MPHSWSIPPAPKIRPLERPLSLATTQGDANTATGYQALYSNTGNSTGGNSNTATGYQALYSNAGSNSTGGNSNTATGYQALLSNITGNLNTATGGAALLGNTTGFLNTAFGFNAGSSVTTADNVICIGANGQNVSHSCYIGNIWNQPGGSQAVYVNSEGKLGAQVSSRRFKDEIKPMEQTSEVIYGLKPVSFRYKPEIEPTRPVGFGLIAEDVEKISPDLVTRGGGKVNSVRYDAVNAMLLNEFLKEHRKIEAQQSKIDKQEATMTELRSIIAQQQEGMEVLAMRLEEYRSQIQKVSAQIGVRKPAPQAVVNNR